MWAAAQRAINVNDIAMLSVFGPPDIFSERRLRGRVPLLEKLGIIEAPGGFSAHGLGYALEDCGAGLAKAAVSCGRLRRGALGSSQPMKCSYWKNRRSNVVQENAVSHFVVQAEEGSATDRVVVALLGRK
ncbi:hypothetical protein Nepgr_021484 [Nepenthes gracilis]|uniref:Uncharacterized protein n=1 Tax=Nepenthes gracilis TaxID=150966 RepID=A0AAD3SY78_NEPGR|nr:hypothetical protein Nepgr_021484 [Nepenthes gracilis]